MSYLNSPRKSKKMPLGIPYIIGNELAERFSFYGMRALLVLYIIKDYMASVENNEEIAYGIYAAYGALVYATPLLGGFIADRFIGYTAYRVTQETGMKFDH